METAAQVVRMRNEKGQFVKTNKKEGEIMELLVRADDKWFKAQFNQTDGLVFGEQVTGKKKDLTEGYLTASAVSYGWAEQEFPEESVKALLGAEKKGTVKKVYVKADVKKELVEKLEKRAEKKAKTTKTENPEPGDGVEKADTFTATAEEKWEKEFWGDFAPLCKDCVKDCKQSSKVELYCKTFKKA